MSIRKAVMGGLFAGALAILGIGLAFAQNQGGGGGGGGGGPRGGGRFDPAQMMQRRMDGIKQSLGISDEDWKVMQPKVEAVLTAQRNAGMGMMGMRAGGRRGGQAGGGQAGGGNAPAAAATTPETEVGKATQDLQTTLENKDAAPDVIKAKLTALREAREKARQELTKAQDGLKEILTVRQEAQMVLDTVLE